MSGDRCTAALLLQVVTDLQKGLVVHPEANWTLLLVHMGERGHVAVALSCWGLCGGAAGGCRVMGVLANVQLGMSSPYDLLTSTVGQKLKGCFYWG